MKPRSGQSAPFVVFLPCVWTNSGKSWDSTEKTQKKSLSTSSVTRVGAMFDSGTKKELRSSKPEKVRTNRNIYVLSEHRTTFFFLKHHVTAILNWTQNVCLISSTFLTTYDTMRDSLSSCWVTVLRHQSIYRDSDWRDIKYSVFSERILKTDRCESMQDSESCSVDGD